MSKKTKRQTRKAPAANSVAVAVPRSTSGPTLSAAGGTGMFEKEFKPDYSQTVKDLRRIGILAGSFFVILVALSFFLR